MGSTASKMTLFSVIFNLLICLGVPRLNAQPKAWASLQPDRIETGDTTALLIFVTGINTAPRDVDFKAWAGVFPPGNVIRKSEWRRSGAQWTRRYTLIAFDSAQLALPPLPVLIATGKLLNTNALTLKVFPTRAGRSLTDMAPIRDIRRQPRSWLDYWAWMAGGALVCVLLGYFLWRNRRPVQRPLPVVAPEIPVVQPNERALEQLSQLQQKQGWKKGQLQAHYTTFGVILREYVEARFRIPALESTTIELEKIGLKQGLSPDFHRPLIQILQKIDLAKYAHIPPADTEHESLLLQARDLVLPRPLFTEKKPQSSTETPQKRLPTSGKYEPL